MRNEVMDRNNKPLSLSEVLLMMQSKFDSEKCGKIIEMNGLGEFYVCDNYSDIPIELFTFDLTRSPEDQCEEVLKELYKNLIEKI